MDRMAYKLLPIRRAPLMTRNAFRWQTFQVEAVYWISDHWRYFVSCALITSCGCLRSKGVGDENRVLHTRCFVKKLYKLSHCCIMTKKTPPERYEFYISFPWGSPWISFAWRVYANSVHHAHTYTCMYAHTHTHKKYISFDPQNELFGITDTDLAKQIRLLSKR